MQLSPPFFGWISCGQVDCEEGSGVIPSVVNNDDTQPFSRACYYKYVVKEAPQGCFFSVFFVFFHVSREDYTQGAAKYTYVSADHRTSSDPPGG